MTPLVLAAALAFGIAALITPLVRAFARHIGAVAAPKRDRWHAKPTAMLGGVAIYLASIAAILVLVPNTRRGWIVIGASTALFAIGLIDDFLGLKPYQKLIGQILGAAMVVQFGLALPWTSSFVVNMLITFFWLVGVTNAVNMLDNMDGLAAGVAAIAALTLAGNFFLNGQPVEALLLCAFFGALAGFLIYNHNPASIFMGDCGSMFVGFFLASVALLSGEGGGRSRSVVSVLAAPVLILCIPIFDTTFVTLMRKLAGRAASQGGRDHTSHRLVALGLSERNAVWLLYALAAAGGALAMIVRGATIDIALLATVSFSVVLVMVGVYLGRVRVYEDAEVEAARARPLVSFLFDLSYRRRIFEVALDVVLFVGSYYLAYVAAAATIPGKTHAWSFFLATLPVIIAVKLATFLFVGVYRGIWRYAGISDLLTYARAVLISSGVSVVAVAFWFGMQSFPRRAFVLDGVFLLMLVTGSRFAFHFLRRVLPAPHARTGTRVLIFGAGDAGELLFRELWNNPSLQRVPAGFIDDDPRKQGKSLHGLSVYSGSDIAAACQRSDTREIIVSTARIPAARLREIGLACREAGILVRRMRIELTAISPADLGWVMADSTATDDLLTPPPALKLPVKPSSPTAH